MRAYFKSQAFWYEQKLVICKLSNLYLWAVILFRNVEHCGISSALGINSRNSGIRRKSGIVWSRNRWEFLGILSDTGIAIYNILLSWLLHLVMIQFQSEIPESLGIPCNSAQFRLDTIPGIPDRNWTVFRWNNLQAYHNAWGWGQTCDFG